MANAYYLTQVDAKFGLYKVCMRDLKCVWVSDTLTETNAWKLLRQVRGHKPSRPTVEKPGVWERIPWHK